MNPTTTTTTTPLLCLALALAAPVTADVIYETEDPFGSPFGFIGFDVFVGQSVAVRFTPDAGYTLEKIGVWFMNNDFSGGTHPLVTVTLRTNQDDKGTSTPSEKILETWTFNVSAVGWDPMLETMASVAHPLLEAGQHYWIATESEAPPALDGVWNLASPGLGFMSTIDFFSSPEWQPGGLGAVVATIVEGTLHVPGDADGDGIVGFADLLAVITAWGPCPEGGGCPADLDGNMIVDFADLLIVLTNWT